MSQIRSKHIEAEEEGAEVQPERRRKPYAKPEIIHELELETRAGSPLVAPPWADFPGLDIPGTEGP